MDNIFQSIGVAQYGYIVMIRVDLKLEPNKVNHLFMI